MSDYTWFKLQTEYVVWVDAPGYLARCSYILDTGNYSPLMLVHRHRATRFDNAYEAERLMHRAQYEFPKTGLARVKYTVHVVAIEVLRNRKVWANGKNETEEERRLTQQDINNIPRR